ncbi:MAG: C4-type zinc ribbon domain-containing protein [Opitutaceae bacterium]
MRGMVPQWLEKLLILQDRDAHRALLEKQLDAVPREREAAERKIAGHRAAIEAAQHRVRELELERSRLEQEIASVEEQVRKYRNQQIQVKKNEEYQALTHEIAATEARISELEGAEIQVLYDLDTVRAKSAEVVATEKTEIAFQEKQIARMAEREVQLKVELESARAAVEAARSEVPLKSISVYDRLASSLALPVIVPLEGQKCTGCHLRVSAGVDAEVRGGGELTACDNCTRILYSEA